MNPFAHDNHVVKILFGDDSFNIPWYLDDVLKWRQRCFIQGSFTSSGHHLVCSLFAIVLHSLIMETRCNNVHFDVFHYYYSSMYFRWIVCWALSMHRAHESSADAYSWFGFYNGLRSKLKATCRAKFNLGLLKHFSLIFWDYSFILLWKCAVLCTLQSKMIFYSMQTKLGNLLTFEYINVIGIYNYRNTFMK